METNALYGGSFDPITNGHLDIIARVSKLFNKVYVVLAVNSDKKYTFTEKERKLMIDKVLKSEGLTNVECVISTNELLVDVAKKYGCNVLIRGLRAVTDYEQETSMSLINSSINSEIETLFITSSPLHTYISSSSVRELARYKADISKLVPSIITNFIKQKFNY